MNSAMRVTRSGRAPVNSSFMTAALVVSRQSQGRGTPCCRPPLVFAGDVVDRGQAAPGDTVKVVDPGGRALGVAHYSSTSQICLRLLSNRVEEAGREFFLRRLTAAIDYRRQVVSGSDACRLVYGEADRLPGLVVDRYGDYLVVQMLDQGWTRRQSDHGLFTATAGAKSNRSQDDTGVREKESLPLETSVLGGEVPPRVAVHMNGLVFQVDLVRGKKTGLFLDQRENYLAAARYPAAGYSTASLRPAASPCTSPPGVRPSRLSTARPRQSRRRAKTAATTVSTTSPSARRTSSIFFRATPPRAGDSRWWCSIRPRSPSPAAPSRSDPRLQGNQPPRARVTRRRRGGWSPAPAPIT